MDSSGVARGHQGGFWRVGGALLLALVTVALAVPGVAAADPSGGTDTGHGQQAEATSAGSGGSEATTSTDATNGQGATATSEEAAAGPNGSGQATNEGGNGNGQATDEGNGQAPNGQASEGQANGNGNANGQGNGDGAGNANGQQAGAAATPAQAPAAGPNAGSPAGDAGSAAPAPTTTTTQQTTAVDQAVSATAVATQHGEGNGNGNGAGNGNGNGEGNGNGNGIGNGIGNGNGNGNGNAYGHGNGNGNASSAVRVDEPGTQAGVTQANQASAAADATATASVGTGGSATVIQTADASATAVQTGIGNVLVSVRVGSPGDDGSVSQVNQATATSSAAVELGSHGDSSVAQTDSTQAAATAVQQQVTNTVVTVRVLSPGTDGAVSQANEAAAAAAAATAAATAVQDDVRNTYVGIRVESPGARGPIGQSSTADGDSTSGGTITVATNGIDTVVIADIVAPELTLPVAGAGGTTVWEWIWTWTADESTLDDAGARLVSGSSWNWTWDDLPGGTLVERQATAAEQAGSWSWDWSWSRELDGWAWGWAQTAALACTTCAWVWNWDWNWSGQPDARDEAAPVEAADSGVPDQATSVSASATSHADASIGQGVTHDAGSVERFAGQIATALQVVESSAVASQELGGATLTIAPKASGQRSLVVTADAAANVSADQMIVQLGDVAGAGMLEQWAGQQVAVAQLAAADAVGAQALDAGVAADGSALATALVASDNEQSVFQHGQLGDGLLVQWSGQLTDVVQIGDASARSTQVVRDRDRNYAARATAVSADLAVAAQASVQDGARSAGIGSQTLSQLVQVAQAAGSVATTAQPADSDSPLATSNAAAINRSLTLQAGTQAMNGASAIDIQELLQEAIVTQEAFASSSSAGGIGGAARTVNCSTIDQSAVQGIGAMIPVGSLDLASFCTPPALGTGDAGAQAGGGASDTAVEAAATVATASVATFVDEDVAAGHGTRSARLRPVSLTPRPGSSQPSTELAPAAAAPARAAARSQISSPVPPQARFDSRPEGSEGRKAVDRESPLPSTGGPPPWASALAEGLAAFGGSGIAAILLALVLTPPALRRVRDGAVVRRPISVSVPIDVPV